MASASDFRKFLSCDDKKEVLNKLLVTVAATVKPIVLQVCVRMRSLCVSRAGLSQGFSGATASSRAPLPAANGSRHKQSALRGKKRPQGPQSQDIITVYDGGRRNSD